MYSVIHYKGLAMFNFFKKKEVEPTYNEKLQCLMKQSEYLFCLFPGITYTPKYAIYGDCISYSGKPHESFKYKKGIILERTVDEVGITLDVSREIFNNLTSYEFELLLSPELDKIRERFSSQIKKHFGFVDEYHDKLTIRIYLYGIFKQE